MVRATRRRILTLFVAVASVASIAVTPGVSAQEDPPDDSGTSTSTTTSSSTTTSAPPPTSTQPPGDSTTSVPTTTTTTVYVPPIPPDLVDDPRLPVLVDPGPGDGLDIPVAQLPFDPRSVRVLPGRVAAARAALEAAERAFTSLQQGIDLRRATVERLSMRVSRLDTRLRAAVEAAATARQELRDHAVRAYIAGPVDEQLALLRSSDPVDMGVARSYLDVVAASREQLLRRYESKRRGLDSRHARLAAELGEARSELAVLEEQLPEAFVTLIDTTQQLAAYEAGAHAYVEGFVFPVAGDAEFIDSWGYPRMMGTASAHWHQGTDIFAPAGTPLIASENGVLTRIGVASLGGNKLWLIGDSGHEYYYAHLSAFADGIHDGKRVRAGEVIGYVGDTGNARGTPPHLHFEIHPDGKGPVNPYPLLKAAWGARPMVAVVAPPVPPSVPLPPEPAPG